VTYVALALLPLAFGLGDFLGGVFSRRVSPWAVVGFTTAVSALGAGAWAFGTGSLSLNPTDVVAGAISGVLFVIAYALFFTALATGKSGVVSAIVSLSVIPPVVDDLAQGDLPSTLALVGIIAIVVGVIVISQPTAIRQESSKSILLALASALTFGIQYIALDRASTANADVAILVQYAVAALAVVILGLVTRSVGGVTRRDFPRLVGIGLLFAVGGLCLSASMVATNEAVATAVLMSEPIVLALLGFFVLKERLRVAQVVALIVVVLGAIAATMG